MLLPPFQFVWEGSEDLGEAASIFTGVFPYHYSAPDGFNFDNIWRRNALLTGNDQKDAAVLIDRNFELIFFLFANPVRSRWKSSSR